LRLLALLDFPARDLDHDLGALARACCVFGAQSTSELTPIIVCRDRVELQRAASRGRSRAILLSALVPDLPALSLDCDGLLNLLGFATLGELRNPNAVFEWCAEWNKEYFGTSHRDASPHVRKLDAPVISIIAPSKHSGKTLATAHLHATLALRGIAAHVVSVERSPPRLLGLENPKSDYVRLSRSGISATHALRIGDWAPGMAAIEEALTVPNCDCVIIDNSGGSVAPVQPAIIISMDGNATVANRLFAEEARGFELVCSGDECEMGQITYAIETTLVERLGARGDPQTTAALFLHRHLHPGLLPREFSGTPILTWSRSEADLDSMPIGRDTLLITDDYQGSRFLARFSAVAILRVQIRHANWAPVLDVLDRLLI
jgi:hypothetical protein